MPNYYFIYLFVTLSVPLMAQRQQLDSVYIYGKGYAIKSISMFKSVDGQDSAIINCVQKSKKFVYWDRHANDCVDQSGAQSFSLYDVLKVAGSKRKLKRNVLRQFLDTIYFDTAKVYLKQIAFKSAGKDLHFENVRFLQISEEYHTEYILSYPHYHIKLIQLVQTREKNCKNIMDSISFSYEGGDYYLPNQFLLIPK